jgi:hypothetical protein
MVWSVTADRRLMVLCSSGENVGDSCCEILQARNKVNLNVKINVYFFSAFLSESREEEK